MAGAASWSVADVVRWVERQSFDGADALAQQFRGEEINGEALLAYAGGGRKELKEDFGMSIGKIKSNVTPRVASDNDSAAADSASAEAKQAAASMIDYVRRLFMRLSVCRRIRRLPASRTSSRRRLPRSSQLATTARSSRRSSRTSNPRRS